LESVDRLEKRIVDSTPPEDELCHLTTTSALRSWCLSCTDFFREVWARKSHLPACTEKRIPLDILTSLVVPFLASHATGLRTFAFGLWIPPALLAFFFFQRCHQTDEAVSSCGRLSCFLPFSPSPQYPFFARFLPAFHFLDPNVSILATGKMEAFPDLLADLFFCFRRASSLFPPKYSYSTFPFPTSPYPPSLTVIPTGPPSVVIGRRHPG